MNRTLSEITSELRSLLYILEDQAGELDENLEASLDDCEGELKDKINSLLSACDDMTAKASVYKDKAARFTAAQKRLENRVERIKLWIVDNMQAVGLTKFGTDDYPSIGLRKSTRVEIDDSIFWAVARVDQSHYGNYVNEDLKLKPSKKAIKEDLQAGKLVAGAHIEQHYGLKY